jgi:hypothetical protein
MMYNTWELNFKKPDVSETDPVSEMLCSSEHRTMGKVQKLSNPKDFVHYFLILIFKSNTYYNPTYT